MSGLRGMNAVATARTIRGVIASPRLLLAIFLVTFSEVVKSEDERFYSHIKVLFQKVKNIVKLRPIRSSKCNLGNKIFLFANQSVIQKYRKNA